jgi:MATE family multidrug resistance protein
VRETFRIVWPLALAMAAGAANHVCDRLFLAHSSDASLAASLPAMMVATMFVVFFSTTIGYSAVFVSQFHGGGRGRDAVRSFAQGPWLWLMALPLLVAVVPACWFVVDLAGHPEAVRLAEEGVIATFVDGHDWGLPNHAITTEELRQHMPAAAS